MAALILLRKGEHEKKCGWATLKIIVEHDVDQEFPVIVAADINAH